MNRRDLLARLAWLPALPAAIRALGSPPQFITTESAVPTLMPGALFRSRQTYAVFSNGARKLVEYVTWVTHNGETVNGSTRWRIFQRGWSTGGPR
jgi:hypothetical protein